jgi:hypothetical protein
LGAEVDEWTTVRAGKKVSFTYKPIGRNSAEMTAQVEGEEFARLLKKSGLTLPLTRDEVETMCAIVFPRRE